MAASDQSMLLRLLSVSGVLLEMGRSHFPTKAIKPLRQAIGDAFVQVSEQFQWSYSQRHKKRHTKKRESNNCMYLQFFKAFPSRGVTDSELIVLCRHFIQVGLEKENVPQGIL